MMNLPIPLSHLNAEFLPLDGAPHSEEPLLREPIRRIYRVPSSIRTDSVEEYEPKLVSFGPYHFGKPHLRAYEAHKCRVLVHCLRRARKQLRDIEAEVWGTLDDLMSCYDKLGERWLDYPQDLVRVMVVDGCFLLELVRPVFAHPSDDPVYSLRIEAYNC